MSPVAFVNRITINRTRAEVFAYLATFENLPRWNYAIAQTRQVGDEPVGVGTRDRQIRTIPKRAEEYCTLHARGAAALVAPLLTRQISSAVAANLDVLRQLLQRGER